MKEGGITLFKYGHILIFFFTFVDVRLGYPHF